ncbi:MAG: hypothetical protein NVS4B6_24600 [Mycobacterium sp.]
MDEGRSVAVDGSLGSYPYCNLALTNALVPIQGVRPQGGMPNPRNIYTAVIGNPSAAVAYLQILSPTVSGNVAAQASLATPGAQTGITVTLAPNSAVLVNGSTYLLDTDSTRARGSLTAAPTRVESVVVTVTTGPIYNAVDESNAYVVTFTTTVAHATAGAISLMGWATTPTVALGTVLPTQVYGPIGAGGISPLLFGEMGQSYPLGFAIAGTTTPGGNTAPATALVINLGTA